MDVKNNSFGVMFLLKKQKVRGTEAPIYIRITVDGKRCELSTKKYVKVDNWDNVKRIVKGRSQKVRNLNLYLERNKAKVIRCYEEFNIKGDCFTLEDIKNSFLGISEEKHTLNNLFDYHLEKNRNILEWGTLKNYNATQEYFKRYLKEEFNKEDIDILSLKYSFLTGFVNYMKECKTIHSYQSCNHNTIMKHVERFRKVINLAIRNEWLEKDPFLKFKRTLIKTEIEFLTDDEIIRLRTKSFEVHRIAHVRDLFVFACYTGLSYIDIFNLQPANVINGIDGYKWISTRRKKTGQPVKVPILPEALEILEKYKNNPDSSNRGRLLPMLSNQKLNAYLKELADLCAIKKHLTFHMARHTFATTITLSKGIPIETVSKLLGHSSLSTTQIYAKVLEQKVSKDMEILMKV